MKKIGLLTIIAFLVFVLSNCTVKTSNTVGDWYHEISKIIGGYEITAKTKLTIVRNGPGDYQYKTETTVIDQMGGGYPKAQYSSGIIEKDIKDNKWRFSGGDYGDRGGYIVVPSDHWDDYKPTEIQVRFNSGRGNLMTFIR